MSGARAAVDVGTNSVRLLVVDADGATLTRAMTITRLGYRVDRTGHLDDGALARTLDVISDYRDVWTGLGAERVRIAATSAIRDAQDRDRFFEAVERVAGVPAEVLTGRDEAETAFRGASGAVDAPRPRALVDVGGGSTELIVGDALDHVVATVSLQLGCVRLQERLMPSDPPEVDEIGAAVEEVRAQLRIADEALAAQGGRVADCASLVGVAGTITTLAALHAGLRYYDASRIHGTVIPVDAARSITTQLALIPAVDRARLGPMASGREDVIVAGCIIALGVMERYGFTEMVASEADILDGLVAGSAP